MFDVSIAAPKPGPKPEPVSPRLLRELIHPNRSSSIVGIRFSPDGSKLIAGDYPGGIIQVWDVASGEQRTKIESGYGYRATLEYFFVAPDWKSVFVSREGPAKSEAIEKHGKRLTRVEYGGEIRQWDLETGRLLRTYQHDPPRRIRFMEMAPNGSSFVTAEILPGLIEREPEMSTSLWNAKIGTHRPLGDGSAQFQSLYSPDSRSLAAAAYEAGGLLTPTVTLFDLIEKRERWKLSVTENTRAILSAFSPDGTLLAGGYLIYDTPGRWDHWHPKLMVWDVQSGEMAASLDGPQDDHFVMPRFSPDSQTLATTNSRGSPSKLMIWRPREKQPPKEVVLAEGPAGYRLVSWEPAFSPDGKWIAVGSQLIPETRAIDIDPFDAHQPRIHLVDATSCQLRETIIAPHSFGGSVCFSPDGKLLAGSGPGRVLLWDLSQPPGAAAGK